MTADPVGLTLPVARPAFQESLFPSALVSGLAMPMLGSDGRISVPGLPAGLGLDAYVAMLHLYGSIQEADRLVQPYRAELALHPHKLGTTARLAITRLDASHLHENLFYKREDQTAIRAYKARGAFCGMRRVMETEGCRDFLAVSTGNHALGVLKAAELLRPDRVKIVVPNNTSYTQLRGSSVKWL